MRFVSYAQNFEDVILWRALHHVKRGRYIDVGAHDPFIDSVSLAFYNAGWRGVNVEPTPHFAARLREARPDDTVIEAAVSDTAGPIPFFELGGLSSGIKDIAAHHARCGHESREILVNTVRLEHLLNLSDDDVHWLKVDVEGMEAQVLKSWGDCSKRPWVLVIEGTFPNTQEPTHHLWIDEVTNRGYQKAFFDGLSYYFVHEHHEELFTYLTAPANVFDGFSITRTHFSAKTLHEELDAVQNRLNEERRQVNEANAIVGQMQQRLDAASQEQIRALERAVAAEEQHRQSLAAAAEYQRDAVRRIGEARVELARLEERNAQRQERLEEAGQVANWARERAGRLEAELKWTNEAVKSAGNRASEAHRENFELRSTLGQAQMERDQAQADIEELRRDSTERRDAADRLVSELSAQVDQYRAVHGLIEAAAAERSPRWHRLGRALGFAGHDQAWRALSSWSVLVGNQRVPLSTARHPTTNETRIASTSLVPGELRNPYLRANSLEELLRWRDVDFVRCAYVTVLGRQPDDSGERFYTDRLRSGYSKLDVLWELRRSQEGASHDPGIAGFDRALRRARARNWPSRLVRHVGGVVTPSRSSNSKAVGTNPPIPPTVEELSDTDVSRKTITAKIETLELLVDGFGHALRGVANAQLRQETEISALSSSNASPPRSKAAHRPSRNDSVQ